MADPRSHSAPPAAQNAELSTKGSVEHADASPAYASALDRVLSLVDERTTDTGAQQDPLRSEEPAHATNAQVGTQLRVGFVDACEGLKAEVSPLGGGSPVWVAIAPHVDSGLIDRAVSERSLVLLGEWNNQTHIIGLIQTRLPDQTLIAGKNIVVEASEQLTLRSGRAAIALRSDGALEMVGTRIAATSRGVFRLIGRALRLN